MARLVAARGQDDKEDVSVVSSGKGRRRKMHPAASSIISSVWLCHGRFPRPFADHTRENGPSRPGLGRLNDEAESGPQQHTPCMDPSNQVIRRPRLQPAR